MVAAVLSAAARSWPAPLAPPAFHGLAGEFVRLLEPQTEADPAALLIQTLVAFGNVIGREPHFQVEADRHTLNLFAGLVGQTSKGRKGTSWGHVHRVFGGVDPAWAATHVKSGLSSGEGLIWSVRDAILKSRPIKAKGRVVGYEDVIEDAGINDKRLVVIEPELASTLRVLGRDGNTLSPIVRQAWDSGTLRVLTKNSPAQATGAHISIIGHITRDELLRYLDRTEIGNGFANRFLWVCVRRSQCLPEGGLVPEAELRELVQSLKTLADQSRTVGRLTRDAGAKELWADEYSRLSAGKLGLFGAVTSRAEAQVMRLSCLYALLDNAVIVNREHLQAALALWRYCETSARFIFGDAVGDTVADDILKALKDRTGGMTRTDLRDLFGRNRASAEIGRALDLLHEAGLAQVSYDRSTGRPAELWSAIA